MNLKRVQQIDRELQARTRVAQSIQAKYAAHLGLHAAAVIDDDREQILEHRQTLHVLLDRLLDNGEIVQKLTNELGELSRG